MRVFTILYRNVKWRFHNAFTIVITLLQPLLWLILYSSAAKQTMQNTGIDNYTAFILPGILILVSFSTCSSSGMMNYLMKKDGSFYRILIAPMHRGIIILGQLLEAVLCSYLEAAVLCVTALCLSVTLPLNLTVIGCVLILIALTVFFMAGLCYGISMILPNEAVYETVMNAIVLPIFFLSSALFPATGMNNAVAVALSCNPFTYVIDALRALLLNGWIDPHQLAVVIIMLILLNVISFSFAYRQLKKETN